MGLERDGDLDVGVLTSSRKVLSRDPTRCAACARHARTLPNGLKCLPRSYPSSANRGRRSATRTERKSSEWISSSAVTLRTLHRQIRPQRGPPDNGSGRASHHLAKTGNSLWPDHERILSEYKRASCLKPASDCLRTPHCAKKHASLPFYSAGPNPAPALRARKLGVSNKMGVALGHRSVNRQCGCRTRARLSAPRWEKRKTLLLAIGDAAGNLSSEDGRRIFICARQSFGGGRCPWDSEADNRV